MYNWIKWKKKQPKKTKTKQSKQEELQYMHTLKNTSLVIDFSEFFYPSIHSMAA